MQTRHLIFSVFLGFCLLTSCLLYTAFARKSGRLHSEVSRDGNERAMGRSV